MFFLSPQPVAVQKKEGGFTLIETLVAVALFSMVMLMAVGSLVSLLDANRKARNQTDAISNLYAPLESMTRTIREGKSYVLNAGDITVTMADGSTYYYHLDNHQIKRMSGGSDLPLTSAGVSITSLHFEQISNGLAGQQPQILITLKATAGTSIKTATDFELQTTVAQRYYAPIP